jgi:hypothetical protein
MSGELKPCPKCGPHNLIRELSINDRVWVKCTSCTFTAWEEDWNARADDWISEKEKAQFWTKASDTGCCVEWQGSLNSDGYGTFKGGRLAHRLSYAIINGLNPDNLDVIAHRCDNPCCINPDHLFETDQQGNMTDMQMKGRGKQWGASSKYHGVSWRNDTHKWRATFKGNGILNSLGSFTSEVDAAKAYDAYVSARFGSAAVLNFPLPEPPKVI